MRRLEGGATLWGVSLEMAQLPQSTSIPRASVKCVLVEDQILFLEMLSQLLQMQPGLKVVAQAPTVAEGLAACKIHKPDLLILDLELPDGEGLEVARALVRWNPAAKVIILSGHASTFFCPARIGKSILAVVDKTQTFDDLRAELKAILPPLKPVSSRAKAPAKNPLFQKGFSEREAQIFGMIGEGLCSKEIADHLGLSEHTIQSHRKRMAAKLGTQGNELVQVAIAHRRLSFSSPKGE
jgi:DNA-binding NarL/FixJ family response regulator